MKITFVVRVHSLNASRLAFYVPKAVLEFYGLGPQGIQGQIRWRDLPKNLDDVWEVEKFKDGYRTEELPDVGSKLYKHPAGLRGVIPRWTTMPDPGTLVELTITVV